MKGARAGGNDEAEPPDGAEGEHEQGDPVHPLPAALGENAAGAEHMRHRHEHRGVAQQVDEVPRLVGESPAHGHEGGDDDEDEEADPEIGERHVGQGREHRDGLGDRIETGADSVAHREEDSVAEEQVEGGLAEGAMDGDRVILPERVVDDRDSCGQQEHHEDEVGADETGDDAETRHRAAEAREVRGAAVGEVEGDGKRDRAPAQDREQITGAGPAAGVAGSQPRGGGEGRNVGARRSR